MKSGDRVHIDAETKDGGRLVSDGLVVKTYPNQFVQVYANSILATVTVYRAEATLITDPEPPSFAERINPGQFGFSPKLVALVGAIIGHDYGVRDGRGGKLSSLSITSDGYVMAQSTAHESGAFIGDVGDLEANLSIWKEELSPEDQAQFNRLYVANVKDWRNY
jgi:uncharacterized membrane protein